MNSPYKLQQLKTAYLNAIRDAQRAEAAYRTSGEAIQEDPFVTAPDGPYFVALTRAIQLKETARRELANEAHRQNPEVRTDDYQERHPFGDQNA